MSQTITVTKVNNDKSWPPKGSMPGMVLIECEEYGKTALKTHHLGDVRVGAVFNCEYEAKVDKEGKERTAWIVIEGGGQPRQTPPPPRNAPTTRQNAPQSSGGTETRGGAGNTPTAPSGNSGRPGDWSAEEWEALLERALAWGMAKCPAVGLSPAEALPLVSTYVIGCERRNVRPSMGAGMAGVKKGSEIPDPKADDDLIGFEISQADIGDRVKAAGWKMPQLRAWWRQAKGEGAMFIHIVQEELLKLSRPEPAGVDEGDGDSLPF